MKTVTLLLLLTGYCLFFSGSCTFTQPIKDGKTAFSKKQYARAIPMLSEEYKKAETKKEKSKIAFMLGESYRLNMNDDKALEWYKNAYDQQYGSDALKEYAYTLKRTEQYTPAAQQFKDLGIEIGSPYEYRREITACLQAEAWKKDAAYSGYTVNPVAFNSASSDFAPVVYEKDKTVFTSDRKNPSAATLSKKSSEKADVTYAWTGNAYSDILIASGNEVSSFDPLINTRHNEGTPTFNGELTDMYFTRCFTEDKFGDAYCRIMNCHRTPDGWSEPFILPFQKERVNYGHPSITSDGSLLFFSSDDPGGWGGHDIYVCERTPEGWSDPKLLGRSINTPGNEQFPEIDNDTLYFSSDYITGMGGLDIFRSYRTTSGEWSPPQNLKSPVNSGSDDFGWVVDRLSERPEDVLLQGYFTSNRPGGQGRDDIYRFEKRVPPPRPVPDTPQVVNINYKIIIAGYVVEKIFAVPGNPNSKVIGRKPVPGANISVSFGSEKREYTANEDGYFSFEADQQTDYRFFASQEGYLNAATFFSTKGIGQDPANPVQTFEVELLLDKIFRDQEIVLPNIYYDFDRWDIRTDAQPTLDNLAILLFQNPDIKIQLSSHTDCRGNDVYNEDLSQKRAESAVQYLISKGIAENRLTAKGYGESVPAVTCACSRCTEEEHQANRRTAFKIF
jgi:outer membrane protein OmpA-like peptidoglycan-associated protein